jgi:hypothetical protein
LRRHGVETPGVVWKPVQQHHGSAAVGAVRLISDIQPLGLGEADRMAAHGRVKSQALLTAQQAAGCCAGPFAVFERRLA